MDDKANALDKLIEAVEAGKMPMDGSSYKLFGDGWLHVFDAYHGSLDAALALHETLLPGWMWLIDEDGGQVKETTDDIFSASGKNPARVWLLCILRAYRSIQK